MIPPFRGGKPSVRDNLNAIVEAVQALENIRGDGIIQVSRSSTGLIIGIDTQQLQALIPRFKQESSSENVQTVFWAIVTEVPEYDISDKFVVQKVTIDMDSESETYLQYIGDETDIDIERALGFEGAFTRHGADAKDIRNWAPWPDVGEILLIHTKWDYEQTTPALRWFFNIPMIYVGNETESSIRVDDETMITHAVWV